jgi:hypothetical protein
LHPRQAIQYLFSADDPDPVDFSMTPMYCRVDFVNPVIGKALVNLVSDWHGGLRRPVIVSPW